MHGFRRRWLPWLLAAVFATGVGLVAYNAGLAQGLAAAPAAGAPPPYGWHPYGWYHPFFFFPFLPLLFLFGFFVLARLLFWGGYRGRWHHGGCGGVPPAFDEWHRRAHERPEPDGPPAAR
jgi:hypothetical protein